MCLRKFYPYTYQLTWVPVFSGIRRYIIWYKDVRTNLGYYIGSLTIFNSPHIVLMTTIFVFLIGFMLYFYMKARVFLAVLVVFLFSLVMGALSFTFYMYPFYPYFTVFFLMIQSVLFMLTCLDFADFKN